MDPSVLFVHNTNILTRYDAGELLALKDCKQAQSPPSCMYSPHIIRLNILKYNSDHSQSYEKECENFREKLHNLSLTSFDPKFLELLSNYNNGLFSIPPSNTAGELNLPSIWRIFKKIILLQQFPTKILEILHRRYPILTIGGWTSSNNNYQNQTDVMFPGIIQLMKRLSRQDKTTIKILIEGERGEFRLESSQNGKI